MPRSRSANHRRVIALEPRARSLDALARLLGTQGDWSEAATHLEALLAVCEPADRAGVALRLAEALTAAGDEDAARVRLEEAFARDPAAEQVVARLATTYRARREWRKLADLLAKSASHARDKAARLAALREAAELHRRECDDTGGGDTPARAGERSRIRRTARCVSRSRTRSERRGATQRRAPSFARSSTGSAGGGRKSARRSTTSSRGSTSRSATERRRSWSSTPRRGSTLRTRRSSAPSPSSRETTGSSSAPSAPIARSSPCSAVSRTRTRTPRSCAPKSWCSSRRSRAARRRPIEQRSSSSQRWR